jgi:diacylglycerol kinase (ATP)
MEEISRTRGSFSLRKRARSFLHAFRGIALFFKTTHNAWIQACILIAAVIAGIYLQISGTDWMFLFLSAGMVFTAEAFNTAFEIDIDLTSPDYHPFARDTKDIAAGAVLIASCTAVIVGIGIFGRFILALL